MLIQPNIVTKAPGAFATSMTGNAVGSFLCTPQPNFGKVEVSIAANSFDNMVASTTAPASSGRTALLYGPSTEDPNLIRLTPYSSANSTASVAIRVIGWNGYVQSASTLYVPTLLADLTTVAYNTTTGSIPSASIDGNTRHFFHSITVASGVPTVNVYSPGTAAEANTPPASIVVDTIGSQFVTVHFKSNATGTPTLGALWCAI